MTEKEFENIEECDIVYCSENIKNGPKKGWKGEVIHVCGNDIIVYWVKNRIKNNIYFNYKNIIEARGKSIDSASTFFSEEVLESTINSIQERSGEIKPFLRACSLSLKEIKEDQLEFEF